MRKIDSVIVISTESGTIPFSYQLKEGCDNSNIS